MAYIGNSPALKYASFAVQHFTTSATTGYTLDNAVTNENGIALFVNNVRQQPGSSYAYTASGTTLTLSAATTTSDTMYCVFIGKAVQTVNPGAGSVGPSQLATDAVTTVKILDDNVTTAKILDNNVTLAKLGDGTQGDILYYGASGAPARLGFGTSGDFLKTQGTGANPAWATAGGGKVLQVVKTNLATTVESSSGAYATVLTSSTITLASASNYLLCFVSYNIKLRGNGTTATPEVYVQLQKADNTALCTNFFYFSGVSNSSGTSARIENAGCMIGYYTPGSTSEAPLVQYKAAQGAIQFKGTDNVGGSGSISSITVVEIEA